MNNIIELAKKLTTKQRKFVELIIEGRTQTEAYKYAGYKVSSMKASTLSRAASRCMANVQVQQYYQSLQAKVTRETVKSLEYTKQDWLRNQLALLDMAMAKSEIYKVIPMLENLEQYKVKETNLNAAIRIQDQLGKMLGMYNQESLTKTFNLISEISKEAANRNNDSPLPKEHLIN